MRYPVVLFDLDGTIVDSAWMILSSFRHATKTVLGRDIPDEHFMSLVGKGDLYEQMRTIAEDADDEATERLVATYREYYEPLHSELRAFPGMLELLDRLDGEGRMLGVVSAKRSDIVHLAFDALNFGHTMDVVVGSNDAKRGKPFPDQILVALERLGVRAADTAYVGDAPFDIACAKAAGVHAVGVTWGGIHPRERMAEEKPDAIVDTPDELYAVL